MINYRLFFQSTQIQPLNIASLRIMKTCANYGSIAKAISTFDACLSNNSAIPNTDRIDKYGETITNLIQVEMGEKCEGVQIDDYVSNTFHAFVLNKVKIELWISRIIRDVKNKELLNNILISLQKSEWKHGETEFIRRKETDKTNLFQPQIIKMFRNVRRMRMSMSGLYEHGNIYTISFIALLSIIDGTPLKSVVIAYDWNKSEGISWIATLWKLHGDELRAKYQEKGYSIAYETTQTENRIYIKYS